MNASLIRTWSFHSKSPWSLLLRILLSVLMVSPIIPIAAVAGNVREAKAAVADVCGTNNTPNVIALADPTFYIDTGITPQLNATYAGYTIRAGTSSETALSIALSGFTGSVVNIAAYQSLSTTLPTLSPGETTTSYFLLSASGPTETPQGHTITLSRAGVEICSRTFTYTRVAETIKALANKVDSVTQSKPTSNAQVSDQIVVTVEGRTGTLGAGPTYDPGVLSYAPTAINTFPANAWRLETTEMTISPNGVLPANKYVNRLYLSGASGPDRPYTAKYYFRAVDSTAIKASVQPVQYIASGTQVKHTDVGSSVAGDFPIVDPDANITISKSATPTLFSPVGSVVTGGTATYTLAVANIGSTTGYLDKIVDTLPSGVTFTTGSATIGGRSVTPTYDNASRKLTFYGPIAIGAGATLSIRYQNTIPNTAGSYTNSVVGYYGNALIDNSPSTTTSTPATATVTVRPAFGIVDAVADSTSTSANTAITISVLSNDTPSTGVTVTVVRQPSGGAVVVNAGGTITYTPTSGFGGTDTFEYQISNGDTSDTAVVTVKVPQARFDNYGIDIATGNGTITKTWTDALGLKANDLCSAEPCAITAASVDIGTLSVATFSGHVAGGGGFNYTTPGANSVPGSPNNFATITYTLTDANGKTAPGSGRIYISDLAPDRAATAYKTLVNIDVSVNDTCSGPCSSSYDPSTLAATSGTVVATGSPTTFNYTPNDHFMGIDTFNYRKGSKYGTVTVLVGAPDASIETTYGQSVSKTVGSTSYLSAYGGAGARTSRVSCSGCTYSISTAPTKGSVSIESSTGAFTYTPSATASGQDTFNVQLSEPGGLQVSSQVSIFIGPLAQNDPSATDSTAYPYLMKSGNSLSFNVLTNDTCPTTCTVTKLTNPTAGTVTQTVAGGGAFTYTNSTAVGSFSFTYKVESSVSPGLTSTATVRIYVSGGVDDAGTTSPGIPLTLNVRSNDPCTECSITAVSRPNIGSASINANGTITYNPPTTFAGIARFTYTLELLGGQSTIVNVVATVKPDAINDGISSLSGATNVIDVLANDVCSSCLIVSRSNVTGGTATISADGYSISYVAPASGGPYTFDYTVTDAATNQTDTATVTVTLATFPTAVNDATTTVALQAVEINVRSNDTCSSAPCTYDVASDASHGSISLSADPAFEFQYIPAAGFTGTDSFTYSITTALGMSRTATVTIYVTPTAAADYATAGKSQTKVITVTSNDVCFTCTVSMVTQPSSGSIGIISGGDITYIASSTPGTYTFTYRLTETDTTPTSTVDAVVTVVVGDATPDVVATDYQTAVTLDVTTNDTCKTSTPNCSVTSVDVSGGPEGDSAIVVDAGAIDTSIRYTPASGFIGLVTIPYTATWSGSTATTSVTILVGPLALARTTDRNTATSGNVLTGATCTGCRVSLVSAPGVGEISINSDGSYTYTPFNDWLGTDSAITYRITDPVSGLTRDGTLTITVATLTPSIQIVKTGVVDPTWNGNPSRTGPGDRVNYTFTVTNSGLINLFNVRVLDDKIENDTTDIRCPSGGSSNVISSFPAGVTVVCTGFDTLKLADINLGYIDNTATATGSTSSGSVSSSSVSAMSVENRIEISPAAVSETIVTDNSYTKVTLDRIASMTMVKAAIGVTDTDNNGTDAGDTVGYSYTVTNTGNVTLYNVTLIDDKITNDATDIDCPSGGTSNVYATLDPGVAVTCVGTYIATQADLDAGSVTNTGTAFATAPTGVTDPDPANSGITVTLTGGTRISIAKSAGTTINSNVSNPLGGVGDQVPYTYTITNNGQVALVKVAVTDNKIASSAINCASSGTNTQATLAKDASFTCVATYTITQADFDLGSVTNIATVTGDPSTGGVGPTDTATVTVATGTQSPSMTIVKSGVLNRGTNARADAGDTIAYSYLVTNTGNVTLSNVTITDDKIADASISCPATSTSNIVGSLAPGATATCTATYSVLQADVDAGSITNLGTVTSGTTTSFDYETVALTRVSTLTIAKSGVLNVGGNSRADAGDTIAYSYLVTNTGNVTLSNVTITDDKIASSGIVCPSPSASNIVATLAPAATATCTASYSVALADMNTGTVTNRGTATSGSTTSFDDETVALAAAPALSIAKSGVLDQRGNGRADANDTIAYSYLVTNTGNVTLSNVTVTDNKISDDAADIDCPSGGTTNVITSLAPAASQTCVAIYTVTQVDVDASSVTNTATATSGSTTTTGSATVTLTAAPALSVAKSGVLNAGGNGRADANDTIAYSYVVTNTGNVTLSNVTVTDNKISDDAADIDCPSGGTTNVITSLAPAASQTCVATYTVMQGDMDAGSVSNTATATSGSTTTTGSATVTLTRSASMTLSKSSGGIRDLDSNGTDAGDAIDYNYVVTNTGNVTLSSLTVTDDKIANDAVDIDCPSGGTTNVISSLAPSGTVTCVGVYTITDADVTAASVTNIGTLTASVPSGVSSLADVTSTVTVTLAIGAGVDIVKTHGAITDTNTSNPLGGVGDQVTYTYSVTNSGTVALSNVTVTDNKISLSAINCASGGSNTVSSLAGAGTFTCVATYTFTQADIDVGAVTNIGSVSGTPSGGSAVTDTDTNTVFTVARTGAMSVVKNGTLNSGSNSRADAGEAISYTYAVTNTGNITLSNLTITDNKIADSAIHCPAPSTTNVIAALAPGSTVTCTGTYLVTQANINAGSITNVGTLSASVPAGATSVTSVTDTKTVTLTAAPSLSLAKSGSLSAGINGRADAGDTISYSYVVTNYGNITLSSVTVTDDKIDDDATNIDCPSGGSTNVITNLEPADSVTCVAIYTVLQSDVDAGSVRNTGTATSGSTLTTGSRTVTLAATPALTITKSGTLNAGINNMADVGETISYSYVVRNTGNVTLSSVEVTDDKIASSAIQCPSGGTLNIVATMAPGATLTCVATYSVTLANIEAGAITNIGTVSSGVTSATSSKTVTLAGNPSLEVTKSGVLSMGSNSRADAGDLIDYSYAVKNTGNITLSSVTVTDDKIASDATNIDCPAGGASNVIASLEPNQTVTCVASYSITQSNLDMGSVTNTATATDGTNVATGSATINFVDDPRISISKSGVLDVGSNNRVDAGDTITYSFLVRNTGNLTLSNVTVTDDKIADDSVNIHCPSGANTNVKLSLSPGESVTCVGDYIVTQSDMNSGSVTNVGSVSATPPRGGNTTADNTVAVAMSIPTTTTTVAPATTTTTTTVAPATTTTTVASTTTSLVVTRGNLAAADDSVTAPMGVILDIDVLDNDVGSNLKVLSVSSPSSGTATTDGASVIVTPDLMFKGTIDFTYVATDGTSNSTGKVSVKISSNSLQVLPQIFLDINGNGKQDKFEPGMKGIPFGLSLVGRKTISMKSGQISKGSSSVSSSGLDSVNSTGVGAPAVLARFSCASNSQGKCVSLDMPLGQYAVQAKVNLKKLGLTVTADSDGEKDLEATVDPRGDGQPDAQFGLNGTGAVVGYSYVERGDVFSYNPSMDVPLRNVKVNVTWVGLDGEIGTADDLNVVTTTDSKGRYSVEGLPIGAYRVEPSASSFVQGIPVPKSGKVTVKTRSIEQFDLPVRIDGPIPDVLVQTGVDARQLVLVALLATLGGVLLIAMKPKRRKTL